MLERRRRHPNLMMPSLSTNGSTLHMLDPLRRCFFWRTCLRSFILLLSFGSCNNSISSGNHSLCTVLIKIISAWYSSAADEWRDSCLVSLRVGRYFEVRCTFTSHFWVLDCHVSLWTPLLWRWGWLKLVVGTKTWRNERTFLNQGSWSFVFLWRVKRLDFWFRGLIHLWRPLL